MSNRSNRYGNLRGKRTRHNGLDTFPNDVIHVNSDVSRNTRPSELQRPVATLLSRRYQRFKSLLNSNGCAVLVKTKTIVHRPVSIK